MSGTAEELELVFDPLPSDTFNRLVRDNVISANIA